MDSEFRCAWLPIQRCGAGSAGVTARSLRDVRVGVISVETQVVGVGADEAPLSDVAGPDVELDGLGLRSGAMQAWR